MLTELGLDFFRELIYYVAAKWQNGKIRESVMGKSKDATVHIPTDLHHELKMEAVRQRKSLGYLLSQAIKMLLGSKTGEKKNV